ncbi:MAG: hypothetical protein FWG64_04740, partial [Firmicutes bacterium]|nr:hypothetical protein [Bacillota bacterium]
MTNLLNQVSAVLSANNVDNTTSGINKNLENWAIGKNSLLEIFRSNADWNEEHLAIVTTIESSEQTDINNEFFKLWGILYQEHLDLRLGHVVLLSDFHVL